MRSVQASQRHRCLTSRVDRGAVAVEMALVLPLLLLVLFGLIDFGRGFNAQMQITQAAREAVRVKALFGDNTAARTRALDAVGGMAPADVTTSFTSCPASPAATDNARATVSYRFQYITPLGPLADLFGANTLGDEQILSSTGVMRCAG